MEKINTWFKANKLSLNEGKTKYTFFHKIHQKDNIPLKLPTLVINNKEIKRIRSIRFLGVMIDENLSWNEHLKVIENKISKNLGLLYKAKHFLNSDSMRSLYFSFIHCYLNYGNIAWGSTTKSKLKKLYSKQKEAVRTIKDKHKAVETMNTFKILNVYKLNLYQTLIFMFKMKQDTAPVVFRNRVREISHPYPTRHSFNRFEEPKIQLNQTKFSVSSRGPRVWNKLLNNQQASIENELFFKKSIKSTLLLLENEIAFF